MSEPVGWRWIEAWRNGTIGDEEFAALQKLLREDPGARRTWRRYLALDTALRDRAEAQALIAATADAVASVASSADGPIPASAAAAPGSRFAWREFAAWSTAAACLLVAATAWLAGPTAEQGASTIVEAERPSGDGDGAGENRGRAAPGATVAEQRERLLASAADVLHLRLVIGDGDGGGEVAREPVGDVVWSDGRQAGYLRLHGVANGELARRQYQIWIVGGGAANDEFINGGLFFVDRTAGELTVPIQADQFVTTPKMFLVSVEPLGGGDASTSSLLAKADGLGP